MATFWLVANSLAAVNGIFAVGVEVAIGYVGHFVAGVVQTVFGQFDIASF